MEQEQEKKLKISIIILTALVLISLILLIILFILFFNRAPSLSAYEIAVNNGYMGTEQEWIESLHGTNGSNGIGIKDIGTNSEGVLTVVLTDNTVITAGKIVGTDGKDGKDGLNGTDGIDGADGIGITNVGMNDDGELVISLSDGNTYNVGKVVGVDGQNGQDGQDGIDGRDGKDGLNGQNGKDGQDGRGIADVTLTENGELIVYYTDGTSKTAGSIKVSIVITP